MVAPKLLLCISMPAPPPEPPPAPAAHQRGAGARGLALPRSHSDNLGRLRVDHARLIATAAFDSFFSTPPMPTRLPNPPKAPAPTPVFLSSRPNCVMLPMMMASTPSTLPSFAADVGIGAVTVREILLGQDFVESLALDH